MIKINVLKNKNQKASSQNASLPVSNEKKNKGGLLGGLGYVGGSIAAGVGGVAEGVTDVLLALGADITGDHDYAEYVFKDNVVGDWHEELTNEFNPGTGWKFAGDVGSGIGQSATLFIPYAGAPLFFAGIMSQGISGAAAKTGDVGLKEVAYGVTTGAIEGTLEMALGAAGKGAKSIASSAAKSLGKNSIKGLAKSAVRRGVAGKLLSGAAGEFVEEAVSEAIDPMIQRLYQIDPNASASMKDVLYAGLVGAVSGAVTTGAVEIPKSASNRARGARVIKNGNSQTLVNSATILADRLAGAGTDFKNAPEWVRTLRGEIDAYNELVKKGKQNSASAETILGEMQASVGFAEMQAINAGITAKIKSASEADRAALAEYINMTVDAKNRPKTYTAEDIANDTDGVATQLAIMEFAGSAFDIDGVMDVSGDVAQESAIASVIAEESGKAASAEGRVPNEAQGETDPAFEQAMARAQSPAAEAATAQKNADDGNKAISTAERTEATAKLADKVKRAASSIAVEGKLYEISNADVKAIADRAEELIVNGVSEVDAISKAVDEKLVGSISLLNSGNRIETVHAKDRIKKVKGAIINEYRRQTQGEAQRAAAVEKQKILAEEAAKKEASERESKKEPSKYVKVNGRIVPNRAAKTAQKSGEASKKAVESKAQEKGAEAKNKAETTEKKAQTDDQKISQSKEAQTDEQRAERAKARAEAWIEWEKNTRPTAKELNTAREYVKGFDNLSNPRRLAIIRMIRSAKGVDAKIVKGVANLMAIKAGADLEIRFDEKISNEGVTVPMGDKTLILIGTSTDFKKTIKGTIAHELVHYLEKKPGYKAFAEHVMKHVKPEVRSRVEAEVTKDYNEFYTERYRAELEKQGLSGKKLEKAVKDKLASAEHKALIDSEVVANLVGRALDNEKFLSRYARIGNNDNFIKRAYNFLRGMVKELRSRGEESEEARELADIIMPTIKSMDRLLQQGNAKEGVSGEKKYADSENKAKAFSEIAVSTALYDALDHGDAGDDNLILMSKMPRFVEEKLGIAGDFYVYRDHLYENTVSKERAIEEGRPTKRGKKDIHFHDLGEERMIEAIMSINDPIMMIEDKTPDGNPAVFMVLNVLNDDGTPLYASLSFYADRKINGRFEKRPHIVLTISPRPFWSQGGSRDGYAELIAKAVEEKRILSYDKEKGSVLSVIAQHARLGDITEASLNDSISRFKRFVNDFKQKNKINYSLARKESQTNAKDAVYGKSGEAENIPSSKVLQSTVKYSIAKAGELAESTTKYNDKRGAVEPSALKRGVDTMKRMASLMQLYLDKPGVLPPDVIGKTAWKNGSYGRTMENTTLCIRTLTYEYFKDEVAKAIGRPLTVSESLLASQKIYDIATYPQCIYCYVAADRKSYDAFIGEYVADMDKYIKLLKRGGDSDALYDEYLHGRKSTKVQEKRWAEWKRIAKSGEAYITASDINTRSKRNELVNKGGKVALQVKDAMRYAQSASWAKSVSDYVAYGGDILKFSPKMIEMLNSEYGLRMYSFSDYTPAFIVENMQMVLDASVRGLKVLSYTKDADYVRIFGKSGMAINMSCFAKYDAKSGTYVEDSRQGMKWNEVKELRGKYKNAGAVMVVTNDKMLEWALKQDWIDVVIPYHIVKTGTTIAGEYEWRNYTRESADYADGKTANIYPVEHNNDFKTFRKLVEERGITPRFKEWYDKAVSGEISGDLYMKLVNEVRLPANKLLPVNPNFDLQAAMDSFGVDSDGNAVEGGYVDLGGYTGNWFKKGVDVEQEVKVVADDISAGKSVADVSYGRQSVKQATSEPYEKKYSIAKNTPQKMREKLARERAENAKNEQARVFAKKDVKIAVDSIEGWTQEEVLSLAKGQELKGMSRAKREEMISQIYVALHEEGAKGRVGPGSVAVKTFAAEIANDYLDSAQIKGADGKSVHLSEIYDELSINRFKQELTDLLYGEFANMGQTTQNAEFQAIIRAQKESFLQDQLNDKLIGRETRNLAYQGKKLRELVENQKRDGAAEDISKVTKRLAAVVDAKGNIRVNAVDEAMKEASRFFDAEKMKAESAKNMLKTSDGKETQALSDFAWEQNEELKFMIDEYVRLRRGREGRALSTEELKLAAEVLRGMKTTLERYNKEFINGHWVDVDEAAKACVADLTAAWRDKEYKNKAAEILGGTVDWFQEKYFYKILTPETVVETLEGYAKSGILKQLYHSIRVHKQRAEHLAVQMKKPLAEFIDSKDNRYTDKNGREHSFRKKLNEKQISIDGANITLGEAIYLYMLTKREEAHAGLLENGYIVFDDKNQRRAAIAIPDIETVRSNIYNQLDKTDIEFLKLSEDFFNKTASKIKHDADMNIFGYTNIREGYYVPMIRDRYSRMNGVTDARQSIGSIITVYNKSFNQNLVENARALEGKNIMSIINDHADGLADYAELYLPLKAFDRTYNRAVGTSNGSIRSIREVLNNDVWNGTERYFKDLFADIQGQREQRDDVVNNLVGKIRSGWVNSVLGANLKVVATQTTSLVSATQVIGAKYIAKCSYLASPGKIPGLAEIRARAYEYSDIIEARNFDMGALKSQGNVDKINAIGEKTGWAIGWMDERICLAVFHAAELQIQDQQGYAVGTPENAERAARLADEAIYTTQAMSSASERSALQRSTNEIGKMLAMFTSDTVKNLSHLYGNINKWNAYKARVKSGDVSYEAEMKKAGKDIRRSVRTLACTGIMLGLIAQGFKYLYGREEEEPEDKQRDFIADIAGSTLNILPIVSDIADKLFFDYDMSLNVLDVANDTLEAVSGTFKMAGNAMKGEYVSTKQVIKNSINVVKSVGSFFGLPITPVERTVSGLLRFVSPEAAYSYNSNFKAQSYTSDLQAAVESGDERLAEHVLEQLYRNEVAGVYTSAEIEEIVRLYRLTDDGGKHYNVLPQKIGTEINGVVLNKAQRKQFEKVYSQASAEVNKLIRSEYYDDLSDEQRAKAIKNLYALYYNRAASEVTGKEWTQAQAYALLTDNYAALFASQAYKSGLEAVKDASGKEVTVKSQNEAYLKSLGLSDSDYVVISYANGMRSKSNRSALLAHINSLALSDEQKAKLAEALGFEVKNGKVVEKEE